MKKRGLSSSQFLVVLGLELRALYLRGYLLGEHFTT
jgi:hypothetical protein